MKKALRIVSALGLTGMLFLASCSQEEDPNNVTLPGINGSWSVTETSHDFGTTSYSLSVSDSSDASHKLIAFLYGFSKKTYGTMSGSTLTIPVQIIEGNNVSGHGSFVSSNRFELTYYVQSSSSHTDTVTATLTR